MDVSTFRESKTEQKVKYIDIFNSAVDKLYFSSMAIEQAFSNFEKHIGARTMYRSVSRKGNSEDRKEIY
jgi:hypothetical protein